MFLLYSCIFAKILRDFDDVGKLIIFQWYYISIWSDEPQYEDEHIHIYRNKSRQVIGAKFNLKTLEFTKQGDFNRKRDKSNTK